MSTNLNQESTEKLNAILDGIGDKVLADELFQRFYLENPLQYAQRLHSLGSLSDKTKSQLLSLRVGQPPAYEGTDLGPLISRAMDQLWQKLADDARERLSDGQA